MSGAILRISKYSVSITDDSYKGKKCFRVRHPDYKEELDIYTGSSESAIVLAARHWNRRWQDYKFYAYLDIRRIIA